jgi:hypothetical protein
MKYIIGPLILATMVFLWYHFGTRKHELFEVIEGNVYLRGQVVNVKTSRNHLFGIVQVILDSSSLDYTVDEKEQANLPFRIKNDTAEIYKMICAEDSIGYLLSLNGAANVVIVTDKTGRIASQAASHLIHSNVDRAYIRENTAIRSSDYLEPNEFD